MNRNNPYTDPSAVEKELNSKYVGNPDINVKDIQLFVKSDDFNYYPIEFGIDSSGNIRLEDNVSLIHNDIYVGSNKQFIYEQVIINTESIRYDFSTKFCTAWRDDKFIIFRNGHLLNPVLYRIIIPGFDNDYCIKCVYSSTKFLVGDRLDIFYIEGEGKLTDVRFNQDVYIQTRRVYCESKGQVLVKIPYPYNKYPRNKNMFYVFNAQTGKYLDNRYDYTIENTVNYIVLRDNTILTNIQKDHLVFTFPYAKEDFETEVDGDGVGTDSGVSFVMSYSVYEPSSQPYDPTGLITFSPPYGRYTLVKSNIMLFCNGTFVDPSKYKLINNYTVQLLDADDIRHYEFSKYTMLIFSETTNTAKKRYREFEFQTFQIFPSSSSQTVFTVPKVDPKNDNFLVFEGTLFFDVHYRYTWDTTVYPNTITLDTSSGYLPTNKPLTFIFYTNKKSSHRNTKTLELIKIYFESAQDGGSVHMTNSRGYDIIFNKANCVLFMNGTYLEPDRYEIDTENNLTFNGEVDTLKINKSFTGIYLVSHSIEADPDSDMEGPFMYDEMTNGAKEKYLWFDERYADPIITK